jgi:TonB family protein
MKAMLKQMAKMLSIILVVGLVALFPVVGYSIQNGKTSDIELDGLVGRVQKVHTETMQVSRRGNEMVYGKPVVLETSTYDQKGKKVNTIYHPNPNIVSLTGQEVYKYDDKGNIIEMTLTDPKSGTILNKEKYEYEFDSVGNWTKMTAYVAIIEDGKLIFEISEITQRTISYFDTIVKPSTSGIKTEMVKTTPAQTETAKAGETLAKNTANYRLIQKLEGPLNSKAISLPTPVYPPKAKATGAAGKVSVEVIIDTAGKVISARAVSGNTSLYQAAEAAAIQARFDPTALSGQPTKVSGMIDYVFQ